jgi:peptidoglycan hydrolase CwlO-like protein
MTPVPPLRRRLSMPWFIALLAAVLGLGMVGLLVLTTALQNQAFAVQDRQALAGSLANDLSDLQARVADARSVQSLALAAQGLGMVPETHPAQLRLDGTVIGDAGMVLGGELPDLRHRTDEQAAAEEAARVKAEQVAREKAEKQAKAAAERKAKAEQKAKAEAKARAEKKAEAAAKAKAEKKAKQKSGGTKEDPEP